jgi:hypothetical protein
VVSTAGGDVGRHVGMVMAAETQLPLPRLVGAVVAEAALRLD